MIYYTDLTGRRRRYPSAHLALLNWFVDNVEDENHPVVQVASGHLFIEQMLAAVERFHGKMPRINRSGDLEQQCVEILRYLGSSKSILKLKIK